MATKHYLIGGCAVLLLIGAALYAFDRRYGSALYRAWYNFTNEKELPDDQDHGFIYGRDAKPRFTVATILWIVASILGIWKTDLNPFYVVLAGVIEIPFLMIGFYLGPVFDRLWKKKDVLLDEVDKLERGEVNISGEITRVSGRVRSALKVFRKAKTRPAATVPPIESAPAAEAATVVPRPESPADVIDRFAPRRRS